MAIAAHPVVFSDVVPIPKVNAKVRTAALVVGFALLTAVASQIEFHLAWVPVAITLQTLAVLLAGATLGSRLGALSQVVYVVAGLFLPLYAGGEKGWDFAKGENGGYLVGLIVAAYLVGVLAEKAQDRTYITAIPAMLFGSAVIYAFGVPWLGHIDHLSASDAIAKGVNPYVLGDAVKSVIAGALLPVAWTLTRRVAE